MSRTAYVHHCMGILVLQVADVMYCPENETRYDVLLCVIFV